jgi:hypothetical protein
MTHLEQNTVKEFQHLLGKKVKVKFQHKPKNFTTPTGEGFTQFSDEWVGVLQFAGFNPFVHDSFQVTIDRTPLWPVDPNSVELFVDTSVKVVN